MSGKTFVLASVLLLCANSMFALPLDTNPPTLTTPSFIIAEATGPLTGVFFVTSAFDDVDGSVAVICTPPSNSAFPIGNTNVDCVVSDLAGNTTMASFVITIRDTTPPVLLVPASITTGSTSPGGATLNYSAAVTATDVVDGTVSATCSPASGSFFPVGTTMVTCSASDTRGNTRTRSFNLTVTDTFAPTLTVPGDISVDTTSPAGAAVSFAASAVDDVNGNVPVSCTPPSGSVFPVGTTTVECVAFDAAGNDAFGTFNVTVNITDTTPPVLSLPDNISTDATSAAGAVVNYSATAFDDVSGSVPVSCTPPSGSTFPIAMTTVACVATDGAGNQSVGTFSITVHGDASAPSIVSITASDNMLWPPNHKMVPITFSVIAVDDTDNAPFAHIVSITSSESDNGTGDGNTTGDYQITGALSANLRAERKGGGVRTYTITIEVVDDAGNTATGQVLVFVKHK